MAPTMRPHSTLAAVLLCVPLTALAQAAAPSRPAMPSNHPPIGGSSVAAAPSPWSALADYTLTLKLPPKGATGTWTIRTYADPGDVMVDIDTPGTQGRIQGTMLLLGGQAIAARGIALEPGFEIDHLDNAIVNLKLLTRLLDAAVPGGPAAVKGKLAVKARDDKSPIVASTPSANGRIAAPWSLQGSVERIDAATIAFRLEVDASGGDKPAERARWSFTGRAGGTQKDRALDSAMSLAGWNAYTLGQVKTAKPQSSHMTIRFGATKLPGPFATLKDLRAALP